MYLSFCFCTLCIGICVRVFVSVLDIAVMYLGMYMQVCGHSSFSIQARIKFSFQKCTEFSETLCSFMLSVKC